MEANIQPKIFLSYSWANADIADEIDSTFQQIGITFSRDVRDVPYTGSIIKYMQTIGKSDYVLMLISDDYLKSESCMYEVMELLATHDFEKRVLPVLVNGIRVFKLDDQQTYYQYWRAQFNKISKIHLEISDENTLTLKRRVQDICSRLGDFFKIMADLQAKSFEELKRVNYIPMLDKIGYKQQNVVGQVLEILKMTDREDRILALEGVLKKSPSNLHALFYLAFTEQERGNYKIAKCRYEELIVRFPNTADAYNNLGIVITELNLPREVAIDKFENAIKINPHNCYYHNNLATELQHSGRYEEARGNYIKALELNPTFAECYYNFGNLISKHLCSSNEDAKFAEELYKKAISFKSNLYKAYFNLGSLLMKCFLDYEGAIFNYEKSLEINPNYDDAKKSLKELKEIVAQLK